MASEGDGEMGAVWEIIMLMDFDWGCVWIVYGCFNGSLYMLMVFLGCLWDFLMDVDGFRGFSHGFSVGFTICRIVQLNPKNG